MAGDQLIQISREAWRVYPRREQGKQRRDHMMQRLTPDLTLKMLHRYRPAALNQLIVEAVGALLVEWNAAQAAGGGKKDGNTQSLPDPAQPSGAKPEDDRGRIGDDTQHAGASVAPHSQDGGGAMRCDSRASRDTHSRGAVASLPPAQADRQRRSIAARAAVERKLSKLDTFLVNNQPIGDCTPEEANNWAASRERDARFVRMLTANLPPGCRIRDYRSGEEADAEYQRAEEGYAA